MAHISGLYPQKITGSLINLLIKIGFYKQGNLPEIDDKVFDGQFHNRID
jgi:hypothetical protein